MRIIIANMNKKIPPDDRLESGGVAKLDECLTEVQAFEIDLKQKLKEQVSEDTESFIKNQ